MNNNVTSEEAIRKETYIQSPFNDMAPILVFLLFPFIILGYYIRVWREKKRLMRKNSPYIGWRDR